MRLNSMFSHGTLARFTTTVVSFVFLPTSWKHVIRSVSSALELIEKGKDRAGPEIAITGKTQSGGEK